MSALAHESGKPSTCDNRLSCAEGTCERLCIIDEGPRWEAKQFVAAHYDLPFEISAVHGFIPHVEGRPILRQDPLSRGVRKLRRLLASKPWSWEVTAALVEHLRRVEPIAVLAEWGPTAARVREACRLCGVPLIAHFHGYDASESAVLHKLRDEYALLFRDAAAMVVVSKAMRDALADCGAPADKVFLNPYGVDCDFFCGARPEDAPTRFVAVGRLVEKKAPLITIAAFANVAIRFPEARLRVIGDGPLLAACRARADGLGVGDAVDFLGWRDPPEILRELQGARCFVQHSVRAPNGDCEGLPNTILEAGAAGLPVVATRHAGIPDAVVEGETGYLVEEHDGGAMAERMTLFASDPGLAGQIGRAAREHVSANFSIPISLAQLTDIIRRVAA